MIIFLDIDGVLNNQTTGQIDKDCVMALNYFVEKIGGADIVISSSWRLTHTLPTLKSILKSVRADIIGVTPDKRVEGRRKDISLWVEENQCHDYVVLDDVLAENGIPAEKTFIVPNGDIDGLTKQKVDDWLLTYKKHV